MAGKIVVSGGSCALGECLTAHFSVSELAVLTLNPKTSPKNIRQAIHFPFGILAFFTALGSGLIETEALLILSGRRIISSVLISAGFIFTFSYLDKALNTY